MVSAITRITPRTSPLEYETLPVKTPVVTPTRHIDTSAPAQRTMGVDLDVRPHQTVISSPPKLVPTQVATQFVSKEDRFLERIQNGSDNEADVCMFRLLVKLLGDQRVHHHDNASLAYQLALHEQDVKKAVQKDNIKLKQEVEKAGYYQRIASWVSWFLNIITFGAFAERGVRAIRGGGGVVLTGAMVYAQGLLYLARAVNSALKAYIDYSKGSYESRLVERKEKQRQIESKRNTALSKGKEDYTSESQFIKLQTHAVKRRRAATQ